jgi:hypothetical protein
MRKQSNDFAELLVHAQLSQAAAARALGLSDRTLRRYVAGIAVPRTVILALQYVVEHPSSPPPAGTHKRHAPVIAARAEVRAAHSEPPRAPTPARQVASGAGGLLGPPRVSKGGSVLARMASVKVGRGR